MILLTKILSCTSPQLEDLTVTNSIKLKLWFCKNSSLIEATEVQVAERNLVNSCKKVITTKSTTRSSHEPRSSHTALLYPNLNEIPSQIKEMNSPCTAIAREVFLGKNPSNLTNLDTEKKVFLVERLSSIKATRTMTQTLSFLLWFVRCHKARISRRCLHQFFTHRRH
jgi:hypothetical protein